MSKPTLPCLLTLALTASCVAIPEEEQRGTSAVFAAYRDEGGVPTPASFAEAGPGEFLANIWNSPDFVRRFADSYLAETDIEPRVTLTEREDILEIRDLIAQERLDEALEVIRRAQETSGNAIYDFTRANIHFQRDETERAIAGYEDAVFKFNKFRRAWQQLGQLYVREENFEKALPALVRYIELGGSDALSYGFLGIAHARTGNFVAAESAFRMAALLDPQTPEWELGLAESFFQQGRFREAVALLDQLIQRDPMDPKFWDLQANAYIRLGETLKAAENYQVMDRLGAASADGLFNLGDIYINQELFDLAVTPYLRALEADPEAAPERAIRAAKALTDRALHAEARLLVEGIERMRGDVLDVDARKDLLKLRAFIAVAEGATEEEARVLEETIALDPLDGQALILLAEYHGRQGEVDKAAFQYERAAAIEAYEARAKRQLGQLLVNAERFGEALQHLRRANQLNPSEALERYIDQVEVASKANL